VVHRKEMIAMKIRTSAARAGFFALAALMATTFAPQVRAEQPKQIVFV